MCVVQATADELVKLHAEQEMYGDLLLLPIADAYAYGSMLDKYLVWNICTSS